MNKIISILKKNKSIPLDKYIDFALYDKKFGYYVKKNPFGKDGDFITSPLISSLFGEMLGLWCISLWEYLKKPKKILIVELGPGDGSLCLDLLKTFKNFTQFYSCLEINLFEKSKKLIQVQKLKISNKKVKWIYSLNQINSGPVIFIGNEFFDSLPIKQIKKKSNSFFEKHIALSNSKNKIKFIYKKADKKLIKNIKELNLISNGKTVEYPIKAIDYINEISIKIKKYNGGLLVFDYGYEETKNKDTLQSVKRHKYSNVLSEPGYSDITSHVNFKLLTNILKKNDLNVEKITSQNEFLQKMGIIKRAEILSNKMNFGQKANLFYQLKKLLDFKEMGKLFKVLFAKKKNNKFYLGF